MDEELLYLREDVYFEPLINHWYAWPYLIPPVTQARYMVNQQRRIMNSFVKNYRLHILAAKQPGMEGSEFLDCSEDQVEDIKRLIAEIDTDHADCLALSEAVKELDDLLRAHTSGESVEPLYAQVPEALKGFVELVLDMEHRPSYRLLESLIYRSELYKPQLQSASFGVLCADGGRPFALSTPRLADADHVQVDWNFNAPELTQVLQARDRPLSSSRVRSLFEGSRVQGGLDYSALFTSRPPQYRHRPVEEGVRLQYTGHAGLMLETADVTVMVDPIIASRSQSNADEVISFSQLPPKIDYVCITHTHSDHLCLETLLQLRHKIGTVLVPRNNGGSLADPSIKLLLRQFGFNAVDVDDFDEIAIPHGRIVSIPFLGEHGDLNIRSKTAWYIDAHGKSVFMGADSSNLDPAMYRHIKQAIGNIDVLTIGMECVGAPYTWTYGSLYTKLVTKNIKESRRLNGSDATQAMDITRIFKPKAVYLYALGLEPWYNYFMGIGYDENSEQIVQTNQMMEACRALGIPAARLYGRSEISMDFDNASAA